MQFTLKGFREDAGFRVFQFEVVAQDRSRTDYSVKADMELSRRYGIRVQELPLLCRAHLELLTAGELTARHITYAEADMQAYAGKCGAEKEAALRKKALHRHPVKTASAAASAAPLTGWRTPQAR